MLAARRPSLARSAPARSSRSLVPKVRAAAATGEVPGEIYAEYLPLCRFMRAAPD